MLDDYLASGGHRFETIWLENFQSAVNKVVGSEHLQFTAVLWGGSDKADVDKHKLVTVEQEMKFPYLDVQMQ